MVDIPLKLPEIGNALMQGAHAAYYTGKARQEENAFQGEQAARPDIAAAIGGDQGAQGRVAQASPTTFAHIAPHIAKLDADKRAQVKATAEAVAHVSDTLLKTDPKDRATVYPQMVEFLRSQGHDVSKLPPTYTPDFDNQARMYRGQSKDLLTLMQQQEMEAGRNRRHETHGGGTAGGEIPEPGTRPATPAAPGPRADAGPMPGTPPVSVAQAAPGPAAAPPPQMAQVSPGGAGGGSGGPSVPIQIVQGDSPGPTPQPVGAPPTPAGGIPQGFQPMGHRDPAGKLVPALIDGKPVYRNAQGQMMLGEAPAGPPASPAVGPIAEPPDGRMGLNAPPDLKEPPKPDLKNGQLVYEDPALLGGVRMGRQMPNGTWAPTVGVGESHKYKLPNGTEVFYNPHLKPAPSASEMPFTGNGIEAQFGNILQSGNTPTGKTDSPEYALAYQHFARPHTTVDDKGQPITIPGMDMSVFKKPTFNANPDAPAAPKVTVGDVIPEAIKPPNVEQGRDIGFAKRMSEALPILDGVDTQGADVKGRFREWGSFLGGNYGQSKEYQSFMQARDNFINAQLRRESGAAIGEKEYKNADKQYFPQPGDYPETIAQKARNRQVALDAMEVSAGPSYKRAAPPPSAPKPGAPDLKKLYGLE